jgi:hypothetical protein
LLNHFIFWIYNCKGPPPAQNRPAQGSETQSHSSKSGVPSYPGPGIPSRIPVSGGLLQLHPPSRAGIGGVGGIEKTGKGGSGGVTGSGGSKPPPQQQQEDSTNLDLLPDPYASSQQEKSSHHSNSSHTSSHSSSSGGFLFFNFLFSYFFRGN